MKKKSTQFDKFTKKKSNAAIKEQFRQEKKKWKKEREAFFERKKKEARGQRSEDGIQVNPATHTRPQTTDLMPLNKFIAHAGISGRREAADIVKKGLVKVNGQLITEPGHKVSSKDEIKVNGKKIFLAKNLVYILLNKPKDYITTTNDPQERKTVLDIIKNATPERVYPVGRLDRNTSGVLLLTNDGELAQKLTHPSNEVKKVYAVTLNKELEKKDFDQILKGVVLEDGPASVDALAYADVKDKTILGVEIHSGRNRIVRRIFEHLGYDVRNLDSVIFAGLTKKNIERGKWRFLSEKEVRDLKHFGKGR
jgi:23S rRNA pseudouridine2605 synthase